MSEPGPPPAGDELLLRQRYDPRKSLFISIYGRRGSGKSVLAERFWAEWPRQYNALVIDPTGDFAAGDKIIDLHAPLPGRLLLPESNEPGGRWRYRPDMGSPTVEDDLDRAVGLAFYTPREVPFLMVVDEDHVVAKVNKTGPNMRRVYYEARHRRLTVVTCGPRPVNVNPLQLSQSDYAYFFRTPHPIDQDRIAAACGIDLGDLKEAMDGLSRYEYLRYDANPNPEQVAALAKAEGLTERDAREALTLVHMPALPPPTAAERRAADAADTAPTPARG